MAFFKRLRRKVKKTFKDPKKLALAVGTGGLSTQVDIGASETLRNPELATVVGGVGGGVAGFFAGGPVGAAAGASAGASALGGLASQRQDAKAEREAIQRQSELLSVAEDQDRKARFAAALASRRTRNTRRLGRLQTILNTGGAGGLTTARVRRGGFLG